MKIGPFDVIVDERVPRDELWLAQPSTIKHEQVWDGKTLTVRATQQYRVVGKIVA